MIIHNIPNSYLLVFEILWQKEQTLEMYIIILLNKRAMIIVELFFEMVPIL